MRSSEAGPQKQSARAEIRACKWQLVCGGLGLFRRLNADKATVTAFVLKLYIARHEREKCVVFALPDVFAGLMLGAALTHQNRACVDQLPAKALDAQPLTVRIAAVCRGAAAFFMCHDAILFRRACGLKTAARNLEFDVADLNGGVILPMAALNLVLIGPFELEHGELLGAPLLDDFAGHGCFAGIGPQQNLLVVRMDGQDGAKIDLFSHFAIDPLDADGVARRDAILLSPSLNDGVHLSSKSLRQTLIIRVLRVGRQRKKSRKKRCGDALILILRISHRLSRCYAYRARGVYTPGNLYGQLSLDNK